MTDFTPPDSFQYLPRCKVDDAAHAVVRAALSGPRANVNDPGICQQPLYIDFALTEFPVDIVGKITHHSAHVGLNLISLGNFDTGGIAAVESIVL